MSLACDSKSVELLVKHFEGTQTQHLALQTHVEVVIEGKSEVSTDNKGMAITLDRASVGSQSDSDQSVDSMPSSSSSASWAIMANGERCWKTLFQSLFPSFDEISFIS